MKRTLDSIFDLNWSPRLMIEASAGTGKTYTIVGLFVRLLIEKQLDIDRILVMTFTKKATAELRERIFIRLRESLAALEGSYDRSDLFLKELHEKTAEKPEAAKCLRQAIHNFDDAQVFTIHGFCQKVLNEHALLAGVPFELDITQTDELLQQAAEDYWRIFMHRHDGSDAGIYYISKMLELAKTPVELSKHLSQLFSKRYAKIEGEVMGNPIGYLESVLALRQQVINLWNADRDEILRILHKCEVSRFQQHLGSRLNKLIQFLDGETYFQDKPDSLNYFRADYLYDPDNLPKSRKCEPTEKHSFFDLCEQYDDLISEIDSVKTTLIAQSFEAIKIRREELSKQTSSITYDDLLEKVNRALKHPENGGMLAGELLNKYPYALVDEFQDTDPIQYSIFNSIYPQKSSGTGLLMIGDPKQAIYGFRGADIYTYFRARKDSSGDVYTLNRNYRSTPKLIEAVNALFQSDQTPFLENDIDYFPSIAGKAEGETLIVDGESSVPFRVVTRAGVTSNKTDSKEFAYNQVVKEIADLLEKSEKGEVFIGKKRLLAGDVAVLVSGHKDASEIKRKLKMIGVDAVTYSNQQIFETYEAKRIRLLMEAVLHPLDRQAYQNGLFSGFFGLDTATLHRQKENEEERQNLTEELQALREVWETRGFQSMFRSLLCQNGRLVQLGRLDNSDRILTNLFQLSAICSQSEQLEQMDPSTLFTWYQKEMSADATDDEKTLLLESDQNLVKISTIHNSKGLEFPVVFCPVLWEGREQKDKNLLHQYHEDAESELTINIDQLKNEKRREAFEKGAFENIAEEVRKLYVALTRAKYMCTVIWDGHTASHFSGLGALIIGRDKVIESIDKNTKTREDGEINDVLFINRFRDLAATADGAIELRVAEEPERRIKKVEWSDAHSESIMHRVYTGRKELSVQNRLVSFSSLSSKTAQPGEPDYDQIMENYVKAVMGSAEQKSELSIFTFPRGATPGTAIHKLFELDQFDFDTVHKTDLKDDIEVVLADHNIDTKWAGVMQEMLMDVSASGIPGLNLSKVSRVDQIREMEFYFPVKQPSAKRLFQIIRNRKPDSDEMPIMNSMLTGFIDLIVRQNGKYFILDYKSNYLGDTAEDYEHEKLKLEIEHAGYDLQYHLYTAALVKYLRKRMPEFDYEKHFGGVAYLFIRGMKAGLSDGIWFHKPDAATIQMLETELEVQ